MIYKDLFASEDRDIGPKKRYDDECLNCGQDWSHHSGWGCPNISSAFRRFSNLQSKQRYLTASMRDSIESNMTICPICKQNKCGTIDCG